MKITFDPATKTQSTVIDKRWIQNSQTNFVYLYGIEPGWLIRVTFTRADKFKIANMIGIYDLDPDDEYCYVIPVPVEAAAVAGGLGVSIILYEPVDDAYVQHALIAAAGYLYENDSVVSPIGLDDAVQVALELAISNLTTNKIEVSSIVGKSGETINKNTPIYSKLKVDDEFDKVKDGRTVAKKAEQDQYGNVIDEVYANKGEINVFSEPTYFNNDVIIGSGGKVDMNGKKLEGLPTPNADDEATPKEYVDDEIEKVVDGTKTVAKATGDKNGADIANTYVKKTGDTMSGNLAMGTKKVTGLGEGTDNADAVNKSQMDGAVDAHNTDETNVAHTQIRELIAALEREIARKDGRGKSFGEVPYTTAQLLAMNAGDRATAIKNAVEAQDWFDGTFSPLNGYLVYDTGVGAGVDYHEWEYNGSAWVDNGAIMSPKATNDLYGNVKGNAYVSIVAGLMQVLLADNATYLKKATTADKYTYEQLYDELQNRYTKAEQDAFYEGLKAIYGWEQSDIGVLEDEDTILLSALQDYDIVVFIAQVKVPDCDTYFDTKTIKVSSLTGAEERLEFYTPEEGLFGRLITYDEILEFQEVVATSKVKVVGLKMSGTIHNETRGIGQEVILYRPDGKVESATSDNVTTTPTYNGNGKIIKITEEYTLDNKTFETTFEYDRNGKIVVINKVEV